MKPSPLSGKQFTVALWEWLHGYEKHLAPQTIIDYRYYIPRLDRVFREIAKQRGIEWKDFRIDDVNADDLREYQDLRGCGWRLINKELGLVTLCRDEMRQPITEFKRLRKPKGYKSPGKALPRDEEDKLKRACVAAADHRLWDVAALTTLISIESGLGPGELRHCQLGHITMRHWDEVSNEEIPTSIYVCPLGAKRKRRERQVVLRAAPDFGEWALQRLLKRAERLGSIAPDHYLLPKKVLGGYCPYKPMRDWKGAFAALCASVGIKMRKYDCRHHSITVTLKDRRISFAEASQHYGHISEAMRAEYYHGDIEVSKKVAAAAVRSKIIDQHTEKPELKKPAAKIAESEMKKCPECWSDIPIQARRCRYCRQAVLVQAAGTAGD